MRITLEPSKSPEAESSVPYHSVVIDHPDDGLSMETVADLVRGALVAWGFHPHTVNEYLNPDYGDQEEKEL